MEPKADLASLTLYDVARDAIEGAEDAVDDRVEGGVPETEDVDEGEAEVGVALVNEKEG
ncbi:hypothetical protein SESBI_37565 [Sesbania bispinosa]|nr:hypothetical protein SESBI_37565 [Sesbania bispinosa]